MKKFLIVIALIAMGLTAALAQSPSQTDVQEMQKITADFQAGKISLTEFQKRIEAVQKRMGVDVGAYYDDDAPPAAQTRQQSQPQQAARVIKKTAAGTTAGWPTQSAFKRYGFTIPQVNLGNPNGISPSYKTEGEKLIIYFSKNFSSEMTEASIKEADISADDRSALERHIARAIGSEHPAAEMIVDDSTIKSTPNAQHRIRVTIDYRYKEEVQAVISYRTVNFAIIEIEPFTQKAFDGK